MSVAEAIYKETCHVCEVINKSFKKVLRKIQFGMQMNANRQVSRELVSLGFHNQKEYNQIVQRMNDRTINEYYGKY